MHHSLRNQFWRHYLVVLGEEAQVEAWIGQFGGSANINATDHMLGNQFGCTRSNSLMTCVIWNLALVCLEIVLVSAQDMCMVCA